MGKGLQRPYYVELNTAESDLALPALAKTYNK